MTSLVEFNPAQQPRTHAQIMRLLIPLMLVLFISNLDQTIVAAALPSISQQFHDLSGASWVATAYLLTSAVTTLLFGKLGDLYGRKRIFMVSVGLFLLGSVLCGLAPSMLGLILFRALQGLGGGGLNSLVQAIVGDIIPARQRGQYQAYTGLVAMLALIAGPFLGGLFSDVLSWRWIFYINLPVGLVALWSIGRHLHLSAPSRKGQLDMAGGLLATVFTTVTLLLLTLGGQSFGWNSLPALALGAGSLLSLGAYLWQESRAAEPITPLRLFRSPVFSISAVQFFLSTLALFAVMLFVPMFLQSIQGVSAFHAGMSLIPVFVGLILSSMLAGAAIVKTGHYKMYPVIGAVLTGAALWGLGHLSAAVGGWWLSALLFVAGMGIGLFIQVALLAGQNAAEFRDLGVATGALNFFKSLGGAFGAALLGSLLTARLGLHPDASTTLAAFHTVFQASVPFMGLALLLGLVMPEKPLSEEMVQVAEGKVDVPEY